MPFEKVDPIAEAVELQEMFKDNPEAKELFRQFELAHVEALKAEQELKNKLDELRKTVSTEG